MNEAKIREIVEKVIAENMPNNDEITKKVIEAVKEVEKKENDKPWLIKQGEDYWSGDTEDENFWRSHINNYAKTDKAWDTTGLIARTKDELREVIKARKMQREYEQWCMKYPVNWTNEEQPKYYASYTYSDNKVYVWYTLIRENQGIVYCANSEHIQAFIDKVGEQNFIKYVMGIGLPKYFLEV